MKKILNWLGVVVLISLAAFAVLAYMGYKRVACDTDVPSIKISTTYPTLRGMICNVTTAGTYNLILLPADGENAALPFGKNDLSGKTQYFEVTFGGDTAWAAPGTGDYTVALYAAGADTPAAVSDVIHIVNTDKTKIISFTATPEKPQKGQTITLSWKAEHADKCTVSKGTDNLVQVAEDASVASYSEVITEPTYYQLLCFGKGGRIEGTQIKGDFAREYTWVFVSE